MDSMQKLFGNNSTTKTSFQNEVSFKIEKGIPISPINKGHVSRNAIIDFWQTMDVGDSFVVGPDMDATNGRCSRTASSKVSSIYSQITDFFGPGCFRYRTVENPNNKSHLCCRVWKVK